MSFANTTSSASKMYDKSNDTSHDNTSLLTVTKVRKNTPAYQPETDSFEEEFLLQVNSRIQHCLQNDQCLVNPQSSKSATASPTEHEKVQPDVGRKIVFDNIDYYAETHEITEDNQNKDEHWVTVMETENRVSGNHLSSVSPPEEKLISLECGLCLPNMSEHQLQRNDYVILVSRIITSYVHCLKFLNCVTVKHIKHQYSHKTSHPRTAVSMLDVSFLKTFCNMDMCASGQHTVKACK